MHGRNYFLVRVSERLPYEPRLRSFDLQDSALPVEFLAEETLLQEGQKDWVDSRARVLRHQTHCCSVSERPSPVPEWLALVLFFLNSAHRERSI